MGRFKLPSLTPAGLRIILCLLTAALVFVPSAVLFSLASAGDLSFLSTSRFSMCPAPAPQHCPKQSCPSPSVPPAHSHSMSCPTEEQTLFPKVFRQIPSLYVNSSEPLQDPLDWEVLLLPGNSGFLMVEDPQDSSLEPQGYGVSMFHQLHCLTMIRKMLLGQPMSAALEAGGEAWVDDPGHWTHCLDYLVEAVLCAGDDTVEVPRPKTMKDGRVVVGVDGMGHKHLCKNVNPLWEIVEKSAAHPIKEADLHNGQVFG